MADNPDPTPTPVRRKVSVWIPIALLVLFTAGAIPLVRNAVSLLASRTYKQYGKNVYVVVAEPPKIRALAPFNLIDQSGSPFTLDSLKGSVWIADFIFTRCTGPCPIMSSRMADWQKKLASLPDVRLLSVSVDPEFDTPAVLTGYAQSYGATPGKWIFATGEKDEVRRVIQKEFLLAVADSPPETRESDGLVIHSTRLVLVDQTGTIRGYYDSENKDAMGKLRDHIDFLVGAGPAR